MKNLFSIVFAILFAAILQTNALAGDGTVTVQLKASDGVTGVENAAVYYFKSGKQFAGYTDSNGDFSFYITGVTTTTIHLEPENGGRRIWLLVDPATNPVLTAQMVAVTIDLQTCEGSPLTGEAFYYRSGWTSLGNTPVVVDLLPYTGLGPGQGSYDFHVKYDGRTSATYREDVSVNSTVIFNTTKVDLIYPGPIYWYNSGWKLFTSPKEVIGGTANISPYGTRTADFKFGGTSGAYPTVKMDITGCGFTGGFITLVDEAGNPLANYPSEYPAEQRNLKWKYRCGGTWGPETSAKTDALGRIFYNIHSGCTKWDKKITVTLNQTSLEQDVTVNSTFQAAKVNMNLNTCNPANPLSGGVAQQGGGYWYTHGTTDATGTVTFYTFPGSLRVRMNYNYGSNTLNNVPITAGVNNIDFTTTTVNFQNSSTIKIQVGGWPTITMPIELLPGTYGFRFGNTQVSGVEISGCELNGALLKVLDETGKGVAGGKGTPAIGGSWQPTIPGETNANGLLIATLPAGFTKIDMKVGNSSKELTKAQLEASDYTWTTEVLRVYLKNHEGDPITDQTGTLTQGGGTWIGLGNFNSSGYVDVQTFSTNSARYRVTYNCNSETKDGIIVTAGAGIQEVDFQTGLVVGPTATQYQGCGWSTFVNPMEQMPGTRDFKFSDHPTASFTVVAGEILTIPAGTYSLPKQPAEIEIPVEYALSQNYPNPFNPSTTIRVALPDDAEVSLIVYNTLGQKVAELMNGTLSAGYHDVKFDASNLPSGLYIYRVIAKGYDGSEFTSVQKMILMK